MEWSQTIEKGDTWGYMERSRTIKKWDRGMERSRTMENMEIWNGTVPNNEKYGNLEWNGPAQ